ncbi:unnamed protein product, partial [Iphiclides podalirius]
MRVQVTLFGFALNTLTLTWEHGRTTALLSRRHRSPGRGLDVHGEPHEAGFRISLTNGTTLAYQCVGPEVPLHPSSRPPSKRATPNQHQKVAFL